MAWMYILKCSDGSYYVGSTTNLELRIQEHNDGNGSIYTAKRRPVELVFTAEFANIEEAYQAEKRVQGWSRAKREALIRGDYAQLPALAKKDFTKYHRKRGDSLSEYGWFRYGRKCIALLNQREWKIGFDTSGKAPPYATSRSSKLASIRAKNTGLYPTSSLNDGFLSMNKRNL